MDASKTGRLIGAVGVAALGVAAGLAIGGARRAAAKAAVSLQGDWEKQLKREHRGVRRLVKAMAESDIGEAPRRAALLGELAETLTRHAVEEENVIYPALRAVGAGDAVRGLLADHAGMKTMIRRLEETSLEDPDWQEKAKALKALVYRHVLQEERDMFPLLHDGGDPNANEKLTKLVRREAARVPG